MEALATSLDDLRQQQLLLEQQIELEYQRNANSENFTNPLATAQEREHEQNAMRAIREKYQYVPSGGTIQQPMGLNASTEFFLQQHPQSQCLPQSQGRQSAFAPKTTLVSGNGKPPRRAASAAGTVSAASKFSDPNVGAASTTNLPSKSIVTTADRASVLKQLQASRMMALNNYFNAMTNYPNYDERRRKMMEEGLIKPFSFEQREAAKPKSARQRRLEEDRNEKALAEVAAYENGCFKAHAVPPSTFLNKYELMVQEWCARKEAIRAIAEDKANRMKEEEAVLYRYANSFKEAKEKAKRARSAEIDAKFKPFKAKDVPTEIKEKKWPSFAEQEADRQRRIRARAEALLAVSHRPPRMEAAHRESQQQVPGGMMPVAQGAGAMATTAIPGAEVNLNQNNLVGIVGAATGGIPSHMDRADALGCCPAQAHGPSSICLCECHKRTAHAREVAEAQRILSQHNPNFTFQPNVRTDVPDFEYLWAKDRLEMAKRKSHKPPTQPQTFNLTVTRDSKERIIREVEVDRARREADIMTKTLLPMGRVAVAPRTSSASRYHALANNNNNNGNMGTNRLLIEEITPIVPEGFMSREQYEAAYNEALARTYRTTEDGTITFEPKAPRPAGTRAHMMKCEAAYQRLDSKRREEEIRGAEEAIVKQRQAAINKKVQQYLPPSQKRDNERKIEQKRRQFEEQSAEANKRLKEMKRSIANRPPIFVEPFGVTDMIKAKATTEEEVMRLLKETGLDQRTLAAVSAYPTAGSGGSKNEVGGTHSPFTGGSASNAAPNSTVEIVHAVDIEHKKTDEKKSRNDGRSSSSSNSSRSSSSSSASSRKNSRKNSSTSAPAAAASTTAKKKSATSSSSSSRSSSSSSASSRSS